MQYQDRVSNAAVELEQWIANEHREKWSSFCREIRKSYGIGRKAMNNMISEDYPNLTIEGEILARLRGDE